MKSFTHFLQVVTLASWVSAVGFAVIGIGVWGLGQSEKNVTISVGGPNGNIISDIALGELPSTGGHTESDADPRVRDFQAPPQMPELVRMRALPEIPELRPRPGSRDSGGEVSPVSPDAATGDQAAGGSTPKPPTSGRGGSNSGEASAARRLAAGTMPPPRYPREARRRGQEGTVVVEFTVDASGHVVSAAAVKPSRWPLLNQEAVRTVQRWKFPPGDVMKRQLPIVFKLR